MDYQFNHCSGGVDYDQSTNTTNIFVTPGAELPEINDLKTQLATISKAVAVEAHPLKPLIEQIVLLFNPAKVFMLKMAGVTGTDLTMYTELIVLVADQQARFVDVRPVLDIALFKHNRVSYSLHNLGSVMESLKKGHTFYSLYCTTKTVVYDDGKTKLPPITPASLQSMKENVKTTFLCGFAKAFSFYQGAVHIWETSPSNIVLFFLHQTVEFVYRALLRSLNGFDKQTHSIRSLQMLARRCAPQLNAILPSDTAEEKQLLDILEEGYLKPRYEYDYTVSEEMLQLLFTKTRLLQACAKGIVEDVIASV